MYRSGVIKPPLVYKAQLNTVKELTWADGYRYQNDKDGLHPPKKR